MADIVNLRLARKRKERAGREQSAAENRAFHGRSKTERQRQDTVAKTTASHLDGHRRDRTGRD